MSALENVFKLVKEWQPQSLPTELKYRDSLVAFLRERIKDAKIETEYRHSGTTADVYVKQSGFFGSSEVFVELKRNLTLKTQLDRLIGQIHGLQPKKNKIIVVLCGEVNPAWANRFRESFASELYSLIETPAQMGLVLKETAKLGAETALRTGKGPK
jgi:hypothetical protein